MNLLLSLICFSHFDMLVKQCLIVTIQLTVLPLVNDNNAELDQQRGCSIAEWTILISQY